VAVYAIGIIDPADSSSEYGRNFLSELCDISGGLAFFPLSAAEVREALERIAVELRHQYSIEFRPSGSAADGKWRKVKIRVTPPLSQTGTSNPPKPMKIHVRSREGYVAPLSTK
jgi:Ca-activated chloride channel family protein